MRAAWYERQGPAAEVLTVEELPDPRPGPGEVLIRVARSGINPGDVKKRSDAFGVGMPFPRIIPHSDGSGVIEDVGDGVRPGRVGERVWCFGAQSYRPFGTAAEFTVVPESSAIPLPDGVPFDQGACLGIPGITAHRAVHIAGPVGERTVLVQGGGGAVGSCAVALARHAGATVIATVRNSRDEDIARRAGAHEVLRTDRLSRDQTTTSLLGAAPDGVDHVVEVAFHANVALDEQVLNLGGSIATYASGDPRPRIPFWQLVFKNIRVFFLGSDDFPPESKREAAQGLNDCLEGGWTGYEIALTVPLERIAEAHVAVEAGDYAGRVLLAVNDRAF